MSAPSPVASQFVVPLRRQNPVTPAFFGDSRWLRTHVVRFGASARGPAWSGRTRTHDNRVVTDPGRRPNHRFRRSRTGVGHPASLASLQCRSRLA